MDRRIVNIVKQWKDEAHVDGIVLIEERLKDDRLGICTSKPGWLIGKEGKLYNKYISKLQEINPNIKGIRFIETYNWYIR